MSVYNVWTRAGSEERLPIPAMLAYAAAPLLVTSNSESSLPQQLLVFNGGFTSPSCHRDDAYCGDECSNATLLFDPDSRSWLPLQPLLNSPMRRCYRTAVSFPHLPSVLSFSMEESIAMQIKQRVRFGCNLSVVRCSLLISPRCSGRDVSPESLESTTHAAVAVGNTMVVFGGAMAYASSSNDVYIYDVEGDSWERKDPKGPHPNMRTITQLQPSVPPR